MVHNSNMEFGKAKPSRHKGNESNATALKLSKFIKNFIINKESREYVEILSQLKRKLIDCKTLKHKDSAEQMQKYCKMLQIWLKQLHDNVKFFYTERIVIVIDTLNVPWELADDAVRDEVHHLTESLVTHENESVKAVLECLLKKIKPDIQNENLPAYEQNPFGLDEDAITANEKVIYLIERVFIKVPTSFDYLGGKLNFLIRPYLTFPVREHVKFTYNMLVLGELMPRRRKEFFEYIFKNLQDLDLGSPKAEIEEDLSDDEDESDSETEDTFPMEIDGEVCSKSAVKPVSVKRCIIGHKLDMVMCVMFRYIHFKMHGGEMEKFHSILQHPEVPLEVNGCVEGSVKQKPSSPNEVVGCGCGGLAHHTLQLKHLYLDLIFVFEARIMKTTGLSHIQFLIFYMLGCRPTLVTEFLAMLNTKFLRAPSNEERKIALSYFGSFLARGKGVQFSHVNDALKILADWCKNYLQRQIDSGKVFENIQAHQSFYRTCQTLFYVFTFNHKEYTASEKHLKIAHSFYLNELVMSGLNPLKYCSKTTCENFAKITSIYQLAYCNVILLRNQQCKMDVAAESYTGECNLHPQDLEMAFPFDPYLLKTSKRFIRNHYKKFEGIPDDAEDDVEASMCEDDFNMSFNTPRSLDYSYISPHIPCK